MNLGELVPIEREGERVLLTSQLAEAYETTERRISENFNRNGERYIAGKHYFILEGEDKREFLNHTQIADGSKKASKLYLWTEKGALLHAKSLNTDKAWEVYDALVETYFRARQMTSDFSQLSPQLQLLIQLEMEQKRQKAAIQAMEKKLDNIREVVALNPQSWQENCRKILLKIARQRGGNREALQSVATECFSLVDQRGGVSLDVRLTNKKKRMEQEGATQTNLKKITKVDVIAEDRKLIEIYLAVVKEMAIKYNAA